MREFPARSYVFGYGSLVSRDSLSLYLGGDRLNENHVKFGCLRGFRRTWDVAMDNRKDVPGYKVFFDAESGDRLDGCVTFLNIRECANCAVNGVFFAVDPETLARIDLRERSYDRVDVTDACDLDLGSTVWAYIGNEDGVGRYQDGVAQGAAVIERQYFDGVLEAFRAVGEDALAHYMATTDEPEVPLRMLRRVPVA